MTHPPPVPAPVRSFKHRRGRMTAGQRSALARLSSRYVVATSSERLDVEAVFGRRAKLVVDIGFGMGEATLAMATQEPERDVLAIDVHTPGAGALLRAVAAARLPNVRVVVGDAVDVLRDQIASGSCDEIRVWFPDPWPKARHHKRRLVTADFVRVAADRLAPGGRLTMATDWEPYARQMLEAVDAEPLLAGEGFSGRPPWRPVTRYEQQGLAKGHVVRDVLRWRVAPSPR